MIRETLDSLEAFEHLLAEEKRNFCLILRRYVSVRFDSGPFDSGLLINEEIGIASASLFGSDSFWSEGKKRATDSASPLKLA
jgi:hypothetical protein